MVSVITNKSLSLSGLKVNVRILVYGTKIESFPAVPSLPPSSASSTGPSNEEPILQSENDGPLESIQDAAILKKHAIVSLEMGKCAEAKEQLEKDLKIEESFYGCGSSQLEFTMNSLAEAYLGLGDFLTAKRLCEKALTTEIDKFTAVDITCNLGLVYTKVGLFEEAMVELEGAWDALKNRSTYSDHGQLMKAKVLSLLGIIYLFWRC